MDDARVDAGAEHVLRQLQTQGLIPLEERSTQSEITGQSNGLGSPLDRTLKLRRDVGRPEVHRDDLVADLGVLESGDPECRGRLRRLRHIDGQHGELLVALGLGHRRASGQYAGKAPGQRVGTLGRGLLGRAPRQGDVGDARLDNGRHLGRPLPGERLGNGDHMLLHHLICAVLPTSRCRQVLADEELDWVAAQSATVGIGPRHGHLGTLLNQWSGADGARSAVTDHAENHRGPRGLVGGPERRCRARAGDAAGGEGQSGHRQNPESRASQRSGDSVVRQRLHHVNLQLSVGATTRANVFASPAPLRFTRRVYCTFFGNNGQEHPSNDVGGRPGEPRETDLFLDSAPFRAVCRRFPIIATAHRSPIPCCFPQIATYGR